MLSEQSNQKMLVGIKFEIVSLSSILNGRKRRVPLNREIMQNVERSNSQIQNERSLLSLLTLGVAS